jgi:hypothetical protein
MMHDVNNTQDIDIYDLIEFVLYTSQNILFFKTRPMLGKMALTVVTVTINLILCDKNSYG